MNREIQEKDNSVQILETEEDHRGYALKATFDGETFRMEFIAEKRGTLSIREKRGIYCKN